MTRKLALYALYKGDVLLGEGTAKELGERLGFNPHQMTHWVNKKYQASLKPGSNAKTAYRIDKDEEE